MSFELNPELHVLVDHERGKCYKFVEMTPEEVREMKRLYPEFPIAFWAYSRLNKIAKKGEE